MKDEIMQFLQGVPFAQFFGFSNQICNSDFFEFTKNTLINQKNSPCV